MIKTDYELLAAQTKSLVDGEPLLLPNMANIAALLYNSLDEINWVGFYLLMEDEEEPYLSLGPFMGQPACLRIKIGKGVCGTAIKEQKTMNVPDVHAFPGHIACDSASNSELVIPLLRNKKIIGVFDIDSPVTNRFTEEDEAGLSTIVTELMKISEEATRNKLLPYIAPCSLLCYTCPAYKDGLIAETAKSLATHFEGYYDFNSTALPEEYRSWLPEFQQFHEKLKHYENRPCGGCRSFPSGTGCIDGCVVPNCIHEKGIEFCAECNEFPCEKGKSFFHSINDVILNDWLQGNTRIAEVGIEIYFDEKKKLSHYEGYKKQI